MGGLDGKWIRCAEVTLSLLSSESGGAGPCCRAGGGQHEYSLHLTLRPRRGGLLGLTTQGDKYEDTRGSGGASMVTTGIAPESAGHVTVTEERKEDVTGNVTGGRN